VKIISVELSLVVDVEESDVVADVVVDDYIAIIRIDDRLLSGRSRNLFWSIEWPPAPTGRAT
jgi:hypothetical protein